MNSLMHESRAKILIVDDKNSNLFLLRTIFLKVNVDILEARSGKEALEIAKNNDIALFLLDVHMPVMNGFELANILLADDKTAHVPIIFITASHNNNKNIATSYEHGAIDFIEKPIVESMLISKVNVLLKIWLKNQELANAFKIISEKNNELELEIIERQKIQEKLDRLAMIDSLTGLPNRLMLKQVAQKVISSAKRFEQTAGFMFLDLDGFKAINDNNGHDVGDSVLIEASLRINSVIREIDTLGRLGGDEFIIVLPNCHSNSALCIIAQRIVEVINRPIESVSIKESLGVSIGISVFPDDALTSDLLIIHADHAMYEAKKAGKNQYKLYT